MLFINCIKSTYHRLPSSPCKTNLHASKVQQGARINKLYPSDVIDKRQRVGGSKSLRADKMHQRNFSVHTLTLLFTYIKKIHIQNYNKATLKEILINTPVQLPELPFLHITFLYRINLFYKKKIQEFNYDQTNILHIC